MRYHNNLHYNEDTDDRLYDEAVDETGTINTTKLLDTETDKIGEQKQRKTTTDSIEMMDMEI